MTLALGVSCTEGAVVAIDSQRVFWHPDGRIERRIVADKLLTSERFVAAHRGAVPKTWGPLPPLSADFNEAADRVWRLVSSNPGLVVAGKVIDPRHELIVAGGPVGRRVQLALLSNHAEPRFAPTGGGLLVAGAAEDYEPPDSEGWWPPLQPRTISGCVTTALQLCFEIIRRNLARVLDDRDDIPGASWPVCMAVITPETIELRTFGETQALPH
jgi:hypothetical protein